MFGEVERAVHIVDEKGRPTGEGIVEFERKPAAAEAVKACKENVMLLTRSHTFSLLFNHVLLVARLPLLDASQHIYLGWVNLFVKKHRTVGNGWT